MSTIKGKSKENFMFYSLLGGLFSSIGGLFGKFSNYFAWLSIWRIPLFIAMVTFNTVGMVNHVKGLNFSSSSLKATLCSAASNYIFTAVLGGLILGEKLSFVWWCGTLLIVSGLGVIQYQHSTIDKINKKE